MVSKLWIIWERARISNSVLRPQDREMGLACEPNARRACSQRYRLIQLRTILLMSAVTVLLSGTHSCLRGWWCSVYDMEGDQGG